MVDVFISQSVLGISELSQSIGRAYNTKKSILTLFLDLGCVAEHFNESN